MPSTHSGRSWRNMGLHTPCCLHGARPSTMGQAKSRTMRREEELAVDKASLVAQQVAIVEESRAEVRKGLPNHLASVKFNEDDMVACAEMMEAEPFRSMRLPPMIGAPSTAPEAPRAEERRLIEESAAGLKMEATPPVPWWCKCLCQNRERFEDVAIGAESADADKFSLVLFAKKQPFCANLCRRSVLTL